MKWAHNYKRTEKYYDTHDDNDVNIIAKQNFSIQYIESFLTRKN